MSPFRNRRLGAVAVLTAAVIAVAGCGAPDPGPHGADSPSAESASPPAAPLDPLDRYLPSPADEQIIERGLADAVDACVRRHGITPPASLRIEPSPVLEAETSLANIVGSLPLGSAEHFGYTAGADERDSSLLALDSGWSATYELSAADSTTRTRLRAVLTGGEPGVTQGGCLASGVEAVVDHYSRAGQLADDVDAVPLFLTEKAEDEMRQDPRVQSVTAQWHDCMGRAGYVYSSPSAAEGDPRWLSAAGAGMARLATMQRPVATADARCRSSTGYTSVSLTVFDDDMEKLIAAEGTALRLQQFRTEVLSSVERAGQQKF